MGGSAERNCQPSDSAVTGSVSGTAAAAAGAAGVVGGRATCFAFGLLKLSPPRTGQARRTLAASESVAGRRQSRRDRARVLRGNEVQLAAELSSAHARNALADNLSASVCHIRLNISAERCAQPAECVCQPLQPAYASESCAPIELNRTTEFFLRKATSRAEEIALADVDTVVSQQRIGHRDMEEEIRQQELPQIVETLEL